MDIKLALYDRYKGLCMYKKTVSYKVPLSFDAVHGYLKTFTKLWSYFNPMRLADYGIIPVKDIPEKVTQIASVDGGTSLKRTNAIGTSLYNANNQHRTEGTRKSVLTHVYKHGFETLAKAAMNSKEEPTAARKEREDMSELINRLATFQQWPDDNLTSIVPLASFGFYYTGNLDTVQCYKCLVTIGGWSEQDDPETKHRQKNPECVLVRSGQHQAEQTLLKEDSQERNALLGNIEEGPKEHNNDQSPEQEHVKHHNNGATNDYKPPVEILTTQLPRVQSGTPDKSQDRSTATNQMTSQQGSRVTNNMLQGQTDLQSQSVTRPMLLRTTSETLNAIATTGTGGTSTTSGENWFSLRDTNSQEMLSSQPVDYTIETNRLASFVGRWSSACCVQPPELSAAGLYYTGPGDRVQCAWCRGGLYGWEEGDTAIGEHRRHFPQCSYIRDRIYQMVTPVRPSTREQQQQSVSAPHTDNAKIDSKLLEVVSQMGYAANFINKALDSLKEKGESLSVSNLLDVLFELENENENHTDICATLENERNSTRDTPEEDKGYAEGTTSSTNEQMSEKQETGRKASDSEVDDLTKLSEENSRLKGKMVCKVCLDEEVGVVFLPCRHLVCCEECGAAVKHCPVCRTLIVGTVKPFLS